MQAPGSGASQFPDTRWTLIISARTTPAAKQAAMEELLHAYWSPLYHFARRKGLDQDAAQDAVQGFLLQLLSHDLLAPLDPSRGRFRSYLRTALSNYLINEHERLAAQKRGGGAAPLSIDFDVAERHLADTSGGPEAAFDREWALRVMERAFDRLKAELESGKRQGPVAVLEAVFAPRTAAPPAYADLARQHSMTIPQLKSFVHRARLRYRDLVRDEVAQVVGEAGDVEAEIQDLLQALST